MGLRGELYQFKGAAPSYEEIWRNVCLLQGKQVRKTERQDSREEPEAEKPIQPSANGVLLLSGATARLDEGRRRHVELFTSVAGDKIFLSGNSKSLHRSICQVLEQLGGTVACL